MFARASHMLLLRAGVQLGGPGNFMCRICQPPFVFVRAVGPGRTFRCEFCRASRKRLHPRVTSITSSPRFAFGFRSGLVEVPAGAGRPAVHVFLPNEAGRASPKSSIPHARIAQLEEQMTVNHRVASSTPAPALRFSLKS